MQNQLEKGLHLEIVCHIAHLEQHIRIRRAEDGGVPLAEDDLDVGDGNILGHGHVQLALAVPIRAAGVLQAHHLAGILLERVAARSALRGLRGLGGGFAAGKGLGKDGFVIGGDLVLVDELVSEGYRVAGFVGGVGVGGVGLVAVEPGEDETEVGGGNVGDVEGDDEVFGEELVVDNGEHALQDGALPDGVAGDGQGVVGGIAGVADFVGFDWFGSHFGCVRGTYLR